MMRAVAWVASETATSFAIPTQLEGNLIRIPSGVVGVNEACSGVRSLQTALMIGLLLGELKRLSTLRRVALIAGAIVIAFIGNCARAFFLVWIAATKNIAAVDRWHNPASYLIVVAVFAGSLLLAILLSRKNRSVAVVAGVSPANMEGLQPARLHRQRRSQKAEIRGQAEIRDQRSEVSSYFLLPTSYFLVTLCWLLVLELGVHFWYRIHERERDLVRSDQWTVRWPESAPGFRDVHIDALVQSKLRYDLGRRAAWLAPELAPAATAERAPICSMFFFRWNAGGTTILRARAHRPDTCLPNLGWRQISDHGVRNYPVAGKFALPFRHSSFARSGFRGDPSSFAEAFFCMREDFFRRGEQQFDINDLNRQTPSNAAAPERWLPPYVAVMWHNVLSGLRNPGQQVLELVFISSQPLDPAAVEQRFANDIQNIIVVNRSR
jgi:exosortase/archaeosortase family protein